MREIKEKKKKLRDVAGIERNTTHEMCEDEATRKEGNNLLSRRPYR